MYHPLAYLLGPTAASREKYARERILDVAANEERSGLPTRLPFLKMHLCGEDVSGYKPKPPKEVPDFKLGQIIALKKADNTGRTSFFEAVVHFNNAHLDEDLQAIAIKPKDDEEIRLIIGSASTRLFGDLKLTLAFSFPSATGSRAYYGHPFHQVFLHSLNGTNQDHINSDAEYVLAHEFEHARHGSLIRLLLIMTVYVDQVWHEYLSNLVTMRDHGRGDMLYHDLGTDPEYEPHRRAAERFRRRLVSKYGLEPKKAAMALEFAKMEECLASDPRQANFNRFLRYVAGLEYLDTYEHLFGLPLDVIKGIIAETPLL